MEVNDMSRDDKNHLLAGQTMGTTVMIHPMRCERLEWVLPHGVDSFHDLLFPQWSFTAIAMAFAAIFVAALHIFFCSERLGNRNCSSRYRAFLHSFL
jgi:hypothetical protein